MSRLNHSREALLKSIKISEKEIFLFVEGKKVDPAFYDRLLDRNINTQNYRIFRSYEIKGAEQSGGKKVLLSFFNFVKNKSSISGVFGDNPFTILFHLDKDIDDLLNNTIDSDNIIYTDYYSVENYLYKYGDLEKALLASTYCEIDRIQELFGDIRKWIGSKVKHWIPWVTLCIFSQKYKLDCGCGYSRPSVINNNYYEEINDEKYEEFLNRLEAEFEGSEDEFLKELEAIKQMVIDYYESDSFDLIFKGDWYRNILSEYLKNNGKVSIINHNSIGKKLESNLLMTLDFEDKWTKNLVSAINTCLDN